MNGEAGPALRCGYALSSPAPGGGGRAGAIGIITLSGDVSGLLNALRIAPVGDKRAVLRHVPDIDSMVVARIGERSALLFPHGGAAVLARVVRALESAGAKRVPLAAQDMFPEARTDFEARMVHALARAESPLAVDVLLDQPRRWGVAGLNVDRPTNNHDRILNRLIDPALVVALGAPNIGKSSLLNALAGRSVAVVADVPGTTRDHVGVMLDLGGLVVRYVDTPGIWSHGANAPAPLAEPSSHAALDEEAQRIALRVASEADLILLCADAGTDFLAPVGSGDVMLLGLRADLGPSRQACDVPVSVREGKNLEHLAGAIRERLVPGAAMADNRPWKFW